jgi:heme-degrading monooxygenase HmoA
MIVREWRGRVGRNRAEAYPQHFRESVVPHLRGVPGFAGASLCRRERGEQVEFVVLTRWHSLESVRAFAGPTLENAVVEPEAAAALDSFDRSVQHYEVLEDL